MLPNKQGFSRWYEKYPNLYQLLIYGENLQYEAQQALAQKILKVLDKNQAMFEKASELQGAGNRNVFGHLKLSMTKRRWYDAIPKLHSYIDTLLFLPDEILFSIDKQFEPAVEDLPCSSRYALAYALITR